MDIRSNWQAVQGRIALACRRSGRSPDEVTLIAVTKTVGIDVIAAAIEAGITNFGENRVREAAEKIEQLAQFRPRIRWHMVGHLQSNKIDKAITIFDMIQSVDSISLAEEIDRRATERMPVLLQVNISGEGTKYGFIEPELELAFKKIKQLPNIEVKGLMTIAPQTDCAEEVRPVFRRLRHLRDNFHLEQLSMGMTNDFEIAIEEGATMVRIGRAIFGERI